MSDYELMLEFLMEKNYVSKSNNAWTFRISYRLLKEGDYFVADIFPLDLVTQSASEEEIEPMIKECVEVFLESCEVLGTLNEVLSGMNWEKDSNGNYSVSTESKMTVSV
jgi:predicted RNase H-like HicB family nuclease